MTTLALPHVSWPFRDLRAGVLLAIGWIVLVAFFVFGVAQPAARLHSLGETVTTSSPVAQR
jgi:hypothetical protein